MARRCGDLARTSSDLPCHDRKPQHRAGFIFGPDMLIRRHDYSVEIAGNSSAAQYMSDLVSIDGIEFPTRRRVYLRDDNLIPMLDTLMVSIDLSGFRFA